MIIGARGLQSRRFAGADSNVNIQSGLEGADTFVDLMHHVGKDGIAAINERPQAEYSIVGVELRENAVGLMVAIALIQDCRHGLCVAAAGKAQGTIGHHAKGLITAQASSDGLQTGHISWKSKSAGRGIQLIFGCRDDGSHRGVSGNVYHRAAHVKDAVHTEDECNTFPGTPMV